MRSTTLLPFVALSLALGGCGGTQNRGLESVHQPVVSRTDYVYDAPARLTFDDRQRLEGWLQTLKFGYGDRIAVDDPSSDPAARDEVARIAARYGVLLTNTAPVTQGELAPGTFRVVVSRARAEVPGCPDWSRTSQPEFNSNSMSNYGCAMNANLAAMVADPEDLVHGREAGGPNDVQTSGKAIKGYRAAPSAAGLPLKVESSRSN